MIVTTVNNNRKYIDHLKVLLKSIAVNSPNEKVAIYLLDFDRTADFLYTINNNIIVKYDFSENFTKNANTNLKNDLRLASSAYAVNAAYDAINFSDYILYLDVDIIVRGDVSKFTKTLKRDTLYITYREKNPLNSRFNAGLFALQSSELSKKFLYSCIEYNNKYTKHWLDQQQSIYINYLNFANKGLKLESLPRSIHDIGCSKEECFLDNSLFWHCKSGHFYNEKFQKEYKKYLEII